MLTPLDEPVLPDGSSLESLLADPVAGDPGVDMVEHEQAMLLERALARLPARH